ncbi:hypothetical protein ACFQNE_03230 [Gordonia phosphorivorans]|uniref:Radical SAM protein n=1 Tax=Gordonia phosphorivorans TaxID=1056982 RepID=A0ABV6H4Q5_9ACTN
MSTHTDDYNGFASAAELAAWQQEKERPYFAVNGHKMVQSPSYTRTGRIFYSSALAVCVDNCGACAAGDPLPDY